MQQIQLPPLAEGEVFAAKDNDYEKGRPELVVVKKDGTFIFGQPRLQLEDVAEALNRYARITSVSLAEGEVYLRGFVNANGEVEHTILLPGDNDSATWQEQMDWAKSIGGDLPTRAELVIAYEQHREKFQETAYWSNTPDTDPGYSGWAWCQDFYYGRQDSYRQDNRLRARAVRRLSI